MNKLKGVFVVMVTPFKENGEIDFEGMEANIESYIANNVQGLLVAGALGEYATMDIEERKSLTEFVMEKVADRVPVVAGTTTNRTEWTIELTNHAADCGAVGAMILPPPGSGLMDEEIYEFYNKVTNSISLSVMVYNNPGSSGMDMGFDLLNRIAKLPNVECVKEASGDVKRISRIADELHGEMEPMCGWEDMHYESFCAGAQGWVCMGANFAPNMTRDLFTLIDEKKDYEAARELSQKYLPVARYLETAGKVSQTCKYIMEKRGLVGGYCRLPKQSLTIEEKKAIDELLKIVELN